MIYLTNTTCKAFALCALVVCAPDLFAQETEQHSLSLAEALAIAKKQNVDVMVARLRVLESKEATHISKAALCHTV